MNYSEIASYLSDAGYTLTLKGIDDSQCLEVKHAFEGWSLRLVHFCTSELTCLPEFLLCDLNKFGNLAHVLPDQNGKYGSVCIGDAESISVNFEQPELAFKESLKRHIDLLTQGILDEEWNREELLREFYANWLSICGNADKEFVCAANGSLEQIKIYRPIRDQRWGLNSKYLGITESTSSLAEFSYIAKQGKKRSIAGEGFVIPIDNLIPAPSSRDGIEDWFLHTISTNKIPATCLQRRGNNFWLIFNAHTPSGRTWFGLHLRYSGKGKKSLPAQKGSLDNWTIDPLRVTIFNKEKVMPRSGAELSLDGKSVLIVGCGSVGGELAQKLGAAGVGRLTLCDPEVYEIDNIYRHVLSHAFIGCSKAHGLSIELNSKFPWIKTDICFDELLSLRKKELLNSYDLIVIAIGSPTHERIFHDYVIKNAIQKPIVSTWLEGYGIGGHAIIDFVNGHGCLRCAYVDLQAGTRGLSSNLNFLENNQNLTKNHAGCGQLFLPYNAISATQTALIASTLAIGALQGKVSSSSKVSWKGDCSEVISNGFLLTHRYTVFDKSLQILPLFREECDLCHAQ